MTNFVLIGFLTCHHSCLVIIMSKTLSLSHPVKQTNSLSVSLTLAHHARALTLSDMLKLSQTHAHTHALAHFIQHLHSQLRTPPIHLHLSFYLPVDIRFARRASNQVPRFPWAAEEPEQADIELINCKNSFWFEPWGSFQKMGKSRPYFFILFICSKLK